MRQHSLILVAEDEESDIELLRLALQRAALPTELIVARDGREAVDYLIAAMDGSASQDHPMPALLLLDLKMPRMNGFEVLAWLAGQPRLKPLPVVVLSSSSLEADIRKARQLGARDYFVKPPVLNELAKILQDIHARCLPAQAMAAPTL